MPNFHWVLNNCERFGFPDEIETQSANDIACPNCGYETKLSQIVHFDSDECPACHGHTFSEFIEHKPLKLIVKTDYPARIEAQKWSLNSRNIRLVEERQEKKRQLERARERDHYYLESSYQEFLNAKVKSLESGISTLDDLYEARLLHGPTVRFLEAVYAYHPDTKAEGLSEKCHESSKVIKNKMIRMTALLTETYKQADTASMAQSFDVANDLYEEARLIKKSIDIERRNLHAIFELSRTLKTPTKR